jgi:hypothetical protein
MAMMVAAILLRLSSLRNTLRASIGIPRLGHHTAPTAFRYERVAVAQHVEVRSESSDLLALKLPRP